jgi:hypothetical protein
MGRILLLDFRASIRALETADFALLSHSALTNKKKIHFSQNQNEFSPFLLTFD